MQTMSTHDKPEPATGKAMGRAGFVAVPHVPHGTPFVMPTNGAARRLRTEGPHAKVWEFRPGAFPELITPIDPPGAIGWTLGGTGWKCNPRAPKC